MAEENHQSEVSVANAYCVVYTLDNNDWKVKGKGWSQVHLYKDTTDGSYRVVGWTVDDSQVVINCNVSLLCQYKKKSLDFYKFIDEEENTYGFGFYKKDPSYQESEAFMKAVIIAINTSEENSNLGGITDDNQEPTDTGDKQDTTEEQPDGLKRGKTIGKMKIFAAKAKKIGKKDNTISEPQNVERNTHVEFDEKTGTYIGLPKEWEDSIKKQFGVRLTQVDMTKVDGYGGKIPTVLITMKSYFDDNDGASADGIFRLAPDGEQSSYVKNLLNKNEFEECDDIHCIANLIKVFFRELPGSILAGVNPEEIIECTDDDKAGEIIEKLIEPNKSIFQWLLDFILEVAAKKDVNRMTEQNLAIVIAPNICEGLKLAPTLQLIFATKAAKFMRFAILYRRKTKSGTGEKDDPTG